MSFDGLLDELIELITRLATLSRCPPQSLKASDLQSIRNSWQCILGIDPESFKWRQYSHFQIQVSTKFDQLDYNFLQSNSKINTKKTDYKSLHIPDTILHTLGHIAVTDTLIQEIDDYSIRHDQTVSQQLTILNKIRNVLLDHQNIASRLSSVDHFLSFLQECYRYEIKHQQKIGLLLDDTPSAPVNMKFDPGYTDALEFHCSDQSFEELYKQCLDALLTMINHDDSQDTIDKKVDKCSRIVLSC
ncbi:unnamed protein product [Ambrosiozyma monospora]|uniref:Unnamed protein product n=1 Tax=Ambrosiozyma monospora TaxID=43982 RepID=A0ACB5TDF7_AMBMO|nr:unnamed protein product [Ambrosiozyma monospora]